MPNATVFRARVRPVLAGRRIPRRAFVCLAAGAAVAGAGAAVRQASQPAGRSSAPPSATLVATSIPSGAAVLVDGKVRATTPARLSLASGDYFLGLHHPAAMDWSAPARIEAGHAVRLAVMLWRRVPIAHPLHPPFPGASISDTAFGADGGAVLHIALPPGEARQLWQRTPDGRLARLGPAEASGPLALAPDGRVVAYLAPADATRAATVWTVDVDGSAPVLCYGLPPRDREAQLVDLAWAPDGAHLLITATRHRPDGALRTQLLWLDPSRGVADVLVELPCDVVTRSIEWDPSGGQAALLTRANGVISLCLLGIAPPAFRYLADLRRSATDEPPFAPLAWAPDGARAVYAAPVQAATRTLGATLFGARTTSGLFTIGAGATEGHRLGDAPGAWPAWHPDGRILALVQRDGQESVILGAVDPSTGGGRDQDPLPLPAGALAGVRWDAARGQALVAVHRDGGGLDYRLLTFASEVQ